MVLVVADLVDGVDAARDRDRELLLFARLDDLKIGRALAPPRLAHGLPKGVESLEGWIYPATYEFEPDTPAKDVIALLVDHQIDLLDELGITIGAHA